MVIRELRFEFTVVSMSFSHSVSFLLLWAILFNGLLRLGLVGAVGPRINLRSSFSQWALGMRRI